MKFLFALFVLSSSLAAFASEDTKAPLINQTFLNGHNLTATSDVLPKGQCIAGLDITACGVTDRISIGTSVWMYTDYNMYSVALRGLLSEDGEHNRWGYQADYFKTMAERKSYADSPIAGTYDYEMEAYWFMLIRTLKYDDHYRLHFNLDANYYADEKMPFSLRRPYTRSTPYQFNFSALHEIDLVHGWFMLGEMGMIDFTRAPLHYHFGASFGRIQGSWQWHLGYSLTGTAKAYISPVDRADYQQQLRNQTPSGYSGILDQSRVDEDFAIHPEFALEYKF